MSILSPLLGVDFLIKMDCTYITRILINDDIRFSRIKLKFNDYSLFPFTVYMRDADEDGKAVPDSPIVRELITHDNYEIIIVTPQQSKTLLIFEFNIARLPEDLSEFELDYNIEPMGIGNQIVTDMYMFETATGIPYRPHSMGSYSEFEFGDKTPWKGFSDYLGKTAVSRMVIGHEHENERGYIDRVYVLPKRGKNHGSYSVKNRGWKNKEEIYIYLDPLHNTKQITSASNNVIRGAMFLASDFPSPYGRIVFKFFTLENGEKIYLRNQDERNGVSIAICKAPDTIPYNNIVYGLSSELSTNPLTLKLAQNETYKEGQFEYKPVFGNFIFYFKGRSSTDPTKMVDIEPIKIRMDNVNFATHTADYTVNGFGEDGKPCTWYLLTPTQTVTLYPQFNYSQQNFVMQPEQTIDFTFFYDLIKNKFKVIAVTDKTDLLNIISILYQETSNILTLDSVPEYIKFPSTHPTKIFKYDDSIVFPLVKNAEPPHEKEVKIPVKYRHITALFKYVFQEYNGIKTFNTIDRGPTSSDTFALSLIPATFFDEFNYKYWGYEDARNGTTYTTMPSENIYTETINGGETFTYKFFYKMINGFLKVRLVDTYDNLLQLNKYKYNDNFIDNYKQIGITKVPANQDNEWTTDSYGKITYKIMDKLFSSENIYYEVVSPLQSEYVFLPTYEGENKLLIVKYKRVVVNPELKITYTGTGCSWQNGYRGAFVDTDTNKVIGIISSDGAILTYDIDSAGFAGVTITENPGLFSILVDIQNPSRQHKKYELYLWNVENGKGGTNPHPCNGFSLDYISAGGSDNKTYINSDYDYKVFTTSKGSIFNNPGLSPVLIINTGEETTSTVFDVQL